MSEKINEENTSYLVSIRLTELVFITKAKDEKEAKISVAKHLINNRSVYGKLVSSIELIPNYLDLFTVMKLSSITRIIYNVTEGHVSNVARMISDFDKTGY